MLDVVIIGAGAAGSVVAKKCAMNREVFGRIHLASRTFSKCERGAGVNASSRDQHFSAGRG